MRVSNDGVYGGIYVQSNEILIYRFMAPNGDLWPDNSKTKQPVMVHQVNHPKFEKMHDLYIFKNPENVSGNGEYQMYVLFEEGILLYNNIQGRTEVPHMVYDFAAESLSLSPGLSDCRNGILMVDAVRMLNN
jgi:hypothetical protein